MVLSGHPGPSAASGSQPHRGDIDGLRALAVVPVVLYHAGVRGFSGGFVGVDIFFVISGYLITGILVRDASAGRHTIADFYRRRVLRIFPALGAVMLASQAGAWIWLLPTEWPGFARAFAATALFGSNLVFYATTDYFNAGNEAQPLLHTWSLAVEEQWYLLWPLVVAALAHRPRWLLGVTAAIVGISLAAAVAWLPFDQPAVFYLLPFRGWELALGALVALHRRPPLAPRLAALLGLAGLVLIGFAVKAYTALTPFPGLAAVPPCVGAALLLETGRTRNLVARLLSLAPLRAIGLISYSLYLWHWPILVFSDTGLIAGRGPVAIVVIVLASFAAATLSWRLIEQPFRLAGPRWSTPGVLRAGGLMMAASVALALIGPGVARVLNPLTPQQQHIAGFLAFDGDQAYRRGTCFIVTWHDHFDRAACLPPSAKPAILFVGDSHAAQLWPGLSRWQDRYAILQATSTECEARRYPDHKPTKCGQTVEFALHDWLMTHHPARVILASRWQLRFLDGIEPTLRDPLVRSAHPVLIGPIPQYSTGLPRLLLTAARRHDPDLLVRSELEEPFVVDAVLSAMAARTGTPYVSLIDLLCDARRHCRTMATPDVPMQFDYGHLTREGSAVVVDLLAPALQQGTQPGAQAVGQSPDQRKGKELARGRLP